MGDKVRARCVASLVAGVAIVATMAGCDRAASDGIGEASAVRRNRTTVPAAAPDLSASRQTASYIGINVAPKPVAGISETGLYPTENWGGSPRRWTNGRGVFVFPAERPPARYLGISIEVVNPAGSKLELVANRTPIATTHVPTATWSELLTLPNLGAHANVQLVVKSDTFRPAGTNPQSEDRRKLGVALLHLALLRESDRVTFAGKPVEGVKESGFHYAEFWDGAPRRWTDGHAKYEIPTRYIKPRQLHLDCYVGNPKGSRISVTVNGKRLLDEEAKRGDFVKTLTLPMLDDAALLELELESDTFVPSREDDQSTDLRQLGVLVRKVALSDAAAVPSASSTSTSSR